MNLVLLVAVYFNAETLAYKEFVKPFKDSAACARELAKWRDEGPREEGISVAMACVPSRPTKSVES